MQQEILYWTDYLHEFSLEFKEHIEDEAIEVRPELLQISNIQYGGTGTSWVNGSTTR